MLSAEAWRCLSTECNGSRAPAAYASLPRSTTTKSGALTWRKQTLMRARSITGSPWPCTGQASHALHLPAGHKISVRSLGCTGPHARWSLEHSPGGDSSR